jgi:hypothetical protein
MSEKKDDPRDNARIAYLELLQLYLRRRLRNLHLLRALVCNWYALKHGEPFLNKSGQGLWLNNLNPANAQHRKVLLSPSFKKSMEAMERIKAGKKCEKGQGLICDHVIPFKRLHDEMMMQLVEPSIEDIEEFLRQYYHVAVITSEQHALLPRSKMPDGWKLGDDPYDRYVQANIRCAPDHAAPPADNAHR